MAEAHHIPYLIKLLDDESYSVHGVIAKELSAFGPNLKQELKNAGLVLNPAQRERVEAIMQGYKQAQLRRMWIHWLKTAPHGDDDVTEGSRLEKAAAIFTEFLCPFDSDSQLSGLLDRLANAYRVKHKTPDCIRLARFLFRETGLRGDDDDYYNPQNGNLVYVITKKRGMPVSLTTVYMLTGLRLGLQIEGCHFPGHFLGRVDVDGEKIYIDCFNGGQAIGEKDLLGLRPGTLKEMKSILREKVDADTIVRCYLANLIRAYQVCGDEGNCQLFIQLFREMDAWGQRSEIFGLTPEDIINRKKPIYQAGQCIYHKRYGYRGIIVDVNIDCMATDVWYYGNQTQPHRDQPWYHVLVHGSDQVTYVAQNDLKEDTSKEKVKHPLLSHFFTKTKEGRYVRNDNPWPETDF